MAVSDHVDLQQFINGVARRNPGQPEFVQAVQEVAEDVTITLKTRRNITSIRFCAGLRNLIVW